MYSIDEEIGKILKKYGTIKLSDLTPEQIDKGKEAISRMDLTQVVPNGKGVKFEDIDSPIQLVQYLNSKAKINSLSEQYVAHYTSFDVVKKILSTKKVYLGNPSDMNDGLEFRGQAMDCSKMFFMSFSLENTENIGMWSMYGQPWEDGVKISIPKKAFMRWPDYIKKVYHASEKSTEVLFENQLNDISFKATASRVAYVEWKNDRTIGKIKCGEKAENEKLKVVDYQLLSGYIKDVAWSYEKELRLRVDLNRTLGEKRIAVDIPNEIYNQIKITTGPRFDHKNNDLKSLGEVGIEKSIFAGKLNYVYCDKCTWKKAGIGF